MEALRPAQVTPEMLAASLSVLWGGGWTKPSTLYSTYSEPSQGRPNLFVSRE